MVMMDSGYREHHVFNQLSEYAGFYKSLSSSILGYFTQGTRAGAYNIDSYVYSSMQGTLESIKHVLLVRRINDAYALLRKYFDLAVINVYTNLYLDTNFSIDKFVVKQIDNWVQGKERLPGYGEMTSYIQSSEKLTAINALLSRDKMYENLRNRCNDHLHYNLFHYLLLNDNEIYIKNRLKTLDGFSKDLRNILILHLSYLFTISPHYMTSSDYIDSLECGLTPAEGSQYWVAPFVQDIFDSVIKKNRMDIATEIIGSTDMKLE